jgi:hypothetical protein
VATSIALDMERPVVSSVSGLEGRLVLDSVGNADAAALRAIRQVVPGTIQEVARLVYQAPSELCRNLNGSTAAEVAQLLQGLGFRVRVAPLDDRFDPGVGEFELSLVVEDAERLPRAILEAAAFLGTDPQTARRLVCHCPAVLVSNVSQATVDALQERFGCIGVELDISHLPQATYHAWIAVENAAVHRSVVELIEGLDRDTTLSITPKMISVSDLSLTKAEALWERVRRTGARTSICNLDLERYDVSLDGAPATPEMGALLERIGVPSRVVKRVLDNLPVIIQRSVRHDSLASTLARVAELGGQARALPHSLQRFALILRSVKQHSEAIKTLVALADMSESAAITAVAATRGTPFGDFTRTTALWLQHTLKLQGAEVGIELL